MRLLLVEDDKKIRSSLKRNLEAECYAVDIAADGEEGVRHARLNEYDLVILDNILPRKTGLEACTEMRAMGLTIPILLLSVQSDIHNKVATLDAGADDYLIKPFSFSELLARLRALQRRSSNYREEVLTYKDLSVDTVRHVTIQDEREVVLTRKEFMLLTYLMQHQGIVLSRGMIMEHVWDMNADPFSNTIESHIASLRRKLKDDDRSTYIVTVPGCGYRFGPGTP